MYRRISAFPLRLSKQLGVFQVGRRRCARDGLGTNRGDALNGGDALKYRDIVDHKPGKIKYFCSWLDLPATQSKYGTAVHPEQNGEYRCNDPSCYNPADQNEVELKTSGALVGYCIGNRRICCPNNVSVS